jgi:hypothetical protein
VIPQVIDAEYAQYSGEYLIGTPSQGDGKKFAYSTNSYYSVVPDVSVANGWFDKSASSSYDQIGILEEDITIGVWGAGCTMATEKMCFKEGTDQCVTDTEFCLVTTELVQSTYDFDGIVGFGKPVNDDYESIMGSTVGTLWAEYGYCPIATFDYNYLGVDSTVTIGCFNDTESFIQTFEASSETLAWALPTISGSIGTSTADRFNNSDSILASAYPFIAIPTDLWTPFKANLTAAGFLCFRSPFTELQNCQIGMSCDDVSYNL